MKRTLIIAVLSAHSLFAQGVATLRAPIALDRLPSGDLFALTQSDGVYRFHENSTTLSKVGYFTLPVEYRPSDLVSALVNKQPALFVAYLALGGGYVSQFRPDGGVVATWGTQHMPGGLDFDPRTDTIYVATYDSAEVYSTSIRDRSGLLKYCGSIFGARQLGPVIVDTSRDQLLVAELQDGRIYSFSLKSHQSRLIASGLGSPQALLLSPDGQYLFFADSARGKIYRLGLSKPNAVPSVFSSSPVFKEPVGLAFLSSGYIAVADERANSLFIISPSGSLVSSK